MEKRGEGSDGKVEIGGGVEGAGVDGVAGCLNAGSILAGVAVNLEAVGWSVWITREWAMSPA